MGARKLSYRVNMDGYFLQVYEYYTYINLKYYDIKCYYIQYVL